MIVLPTFSGSASSVPSAGGGGGGGGGGSSFSAEFDSAHAVLSTSYSAKDLITFPELSALSNATSFTISFWYKGSATTTPAIFGNANSKTNGWVAILDGKFFVYDSAPTCTIANGSTFLTVYNHSPEVVCDTIVVNKNLGRGAPPTGSFSGTTLTLNVASDETLDYLQGDITYVTETLTHQERSFLRSTYTGSSTTQALAGTYNFNARPTPANFSIPNTNWNFYTCVYDSTATNKTKVYVNGTLNSSGDATTTSPSNSGNFHFGAISNESRHWVRTEGKIDDFSIYNFALDATQVSNLYSGTQPTLGSGQSLTNRYTFDDASDTGSGGANKANGVTIGSIVNTANPGTEDSSLVQSTPTFSTDIP
jgi:hypothetical protein